MNIKDVLKNDLYQFSSSIHENTSLPMDITSTDSFHCDLAGNFLLMYC